MAPAVIEFITVTTGSVTMSARADINPWLIAEMAKVVKPARMVAIPGNYGCRVTASDGAWAFSLFRGNVPITTCIVCWTAAAFEPAWEAAQYDAPDNVVLHRPRGVPWLSARIEPSALVALGDPFELMSIAQTELAIGWAILDLAQA
jgi:hypothetical protein